MKWSAGSTENPPGVVLPLKGKSKAGPSVIKFIEHCNNDFVMFVRYVSFDMRINNKKPFELN